MISELTVTIKETILTLVTTPVTIQRMAIMQEFNSCIIAQRIKARSVKDAFREGIPEVGASAVPAGGVTNRSRAASGIS